MIRFAIPLLVATAIAVPAGAAEIQIQATGPVVELTVSESVARDPDIAEISAGVTTQAPTAVEAMQQNAVRMNSVIDRIEALGIAEEDIQTSGINLNAQYDYDQRDQRQIFRGYQASNRVSLTLRATDEVGEVLDALVAAGATDLGGPNWSIDDATAARQQAREAAFASARERALAYARMSGYGDVRLLEVSESIQPDRPMPMMRVQAESLQADASTPVRPGQVEAGVTITVKYQMEG